MEYESYASQIYGQNSFSYPEFIKWAISEIKSCPKWPKLLTPQTNQMIKAQ